MTDKAETALKSISSAGERDGYPILVLLKDVGVQTKVLQEQLTEDSYRGVLMAETRICMLCESINKLRD